jgi:hypothetical protein
MAAAWSVALQKNCGRGGVSVDVYDDEPGGLFIALLVLIVIDRDLIP